MKTGIYVIKCLPTNQCYVGLALDWIKRVGRHIRLLGRGSHPNPKLQAAWNEHGETAFQFNFLESCENDELAERERFWVQKLHACVDGFNTRHFVGNKGGMTHGQTYTRTFKSWGSMIQRCTNPKAPDYLRYGGAGITVCERWKSFENFYADMGDRSEGMTIHRYPNPEGNYEPGNCCWATQREQSRSKKNTIYITYKGETKHLTDWADQFAIPRGVLRRRVKVGVTGDQLFAPTYTAKGLEGVKRRQRAETRFDLHKYEYQGKQLTITEISEVTGLSRACLAQRLLKYYMPLEKALVAGPLKRGKTGPRKGHKMITAFGRTQSLTAWSRELGLSVNALRNRLYRAKMTPEEALRK